jgi:hypothetical protein
LFARRAFSPAVVGVNAEVLVIALAIVVVVSKVTSRRRRPPTARSGKSDFRRARPTLSPISILRRTTTALRGHRHDGDARPIDVIARTPHAHSPSPSPPHRALAATRRSGRARARRAFARAKRWARRAIRVERSTRRRRRR